MNELVRLISAAVRHEWYRPATVGASGS
jgi:hypothetical protein